MNIGKYVVPNTAQTCKMLFVPLHIKIQILSNTLAKIDKAPQKLNTIEVFKLFLF